LFNGTSLAPLVVRDNVADADTLVASGQDIWLASRNASTVTHYDGAGGAILGAARLDGRVLATAPATHGGVWIVVGRKDHTVVGVARPGQPVVVSSRSIRGLLATAIAPTRTGLWITDPSSSTLSLLEAR
jgi:hypothetical protein